MMFIYETHELALSTCSRLKRTEKVIPGILPGPHYKAHLFHSCVCRAEISLVWHPHLPHFELVP